ncbi:MdtA/MuxA family multidrug efflux RND transporter periplasmic adaptor subunit [Azospirillum canadense]|uniref:MdtA/MuxA family multidrug efflux RND transporter periplasmic adaptor subunit n=1 Tax=Azospirillum canadense TaxID=403962 RepID=UPI002225DBEE|nr:MdtA/MuxA family multidrug efflux RND transporter periplasmic adaptor subunit [Azospirillum canadense]MCW2238899.1 multidrug efflux system membrane fusion protein [Azospirillum canadense]
MKGTAAAHGADKPHPDGMPAAMKDSMDLDTPVKLPPESKTPGAEPDTLAPPYQRRTEGRRRSVLGRVIAWVVVLGLIAGGGWWFTTRPTTEQAVRSGRFGGERPPMPVVTAVVEKGDLPIRLNGLGTVSALATVTVRPQVSGQLTQIAFSEGQMVKKGDFLAEVDPRPFQLAVDQAQAQLMRDQAQLKNAQLDLERYRTLVKQDSIAKQQRDTQEALVQQYEGTVKSDQVAVDNAKLNLSYSRITAPVSGRVGLRLVDTGNYVTAGQTTGIVVITQIQPISVLFTLPEDNIPAIMARLRGGATLPVTAFDRTRAKTLATGTLETVDNQIDVTTGTVKLRARFDNADQTLFPNQFVNVQLLVDALAGVPLVPVAAVQRGAPGTFVYVANRQDSTVAVRPITLGPSDGTMTVVEKGLKPGDLVVTEGADKLREGAKVTLPPEGGAPAAGAPNAGVPPSGEGERGQHRRQRNAS